MSLTSPAFPRRAPLTLGLAAFISLFAASPALAQVAPGAGPFSLPALPYATDALEPSIDKATMELHHGKHHQAMVTALNAAVSGDKALAGQTLEQLLAKASSHPAAVRNNAGGHWNHSFFWTLMAPEGKGGAPSKELAKAIDESFGSLDGFKAAFKKAGLAQFGSGWAWLIVEADGKLAVTSTPNQDNPLMDAASKRGTPVLGNDLWEHAYYLKYNNRRADYLDAWWKVVNWKAVSENYAKATAKSK